MRDDELRDRFQALRRQDEAAAPGFESTLAAARAPRREQRFDGWSWAAVAATVPAIALMAVVLGVLDTGGPESGASTLESWSAPSSDLVADLAPLDDPLAALEAFQSPTADFLYFDDRSTP